MCQSIDRSFDEKTHRLFPGAKSLLITTKINVTPFPFIALFAPSRYLDIEIKQTSCPNAGQLIDGDHGTHINKGDQTTVNPVSPDEPQMLLRMANRDTRQRENFAQNASYCQVFSIGIC